MAFGDIASGLGERVAEWAEGLYDENGGPVETVDIVEDEQTNNSLTEMVEDVDWLVVFAGAGFLLALYTAMKK